MVAYAQPVPVFPERLNPLHFFLRAHYALRDHAYRRPYFHGRAFMMREWFFDAPGSLHGVSPKVATRLRLSLGPLVDDIAMSRMAISRWGTSSIREVRQANVYFDPPDTLQGLYAASLRVALEVERLNLLYPEHAVIQREKCENLWQGKGLKLFSLRLRAIHAVYRMIETSVKRVAAMHVVLVKKGVLKVNTLWIRVPGTKHFARDRYSWSRFRKKAPDAFAPK